MFHQKLFYNMKNYQVHSLSAHNKWETYCGRKIVINPFVADNESMAGLIEERKWIQIYLAHHKDDFSAITCEECKKIIQ